MEPCPRCKGFAERIDTNSPNEYRDLIRQLIGTVSTGTFQLVHADCSLEEVLGPVWPGDTLCHEFRCTTCGRAFQLVASTYHGWVIWKPVV